MRQWVLSGAAWALALVVTLGGWWASVQAIECSARAPQPVVRTESIRVGGVERVHELEVVDIAPLRPVDELATVPAIARALRRIQPSLEASEAMDWAMELHAQGELTGLDPLLLVALGRWECGGWQRDCVLGRDVSSAGARGALQVLEGGEAHRTCGLCPLEDPACGIQCGATWLMLLLADPRCADGDLWRAVATYGQASCAGRREARRLYRVRTIRDFYCDLRPDCAERWPR